MSFDVFICHASEDKEAVARPLAEALRSRGLSVWLDEVEIRLGDSLRQKIDEGLLTSTFGVVILSPNFFKKQWAQWELDGLAARETSSGTKVLLPVWHQVGHAEVAAHSPLLASKRAARISDGLEQVADEVAGVLRAPARLPEIDRVPRTPAEEAALLQGRPSGWEHLLFAAVLRRRMETLEPKYRDHELRYARPDTGPVLGFEAAVNFICDAFDEAAALLMNVERVLDERAQERAFGPPGHPGDPLRIQHLAGRLIDVYEGMLDWAARLRAARLPDRFARSVELACLHVDGPIKDFREFVDRAVVEIDRLPALLRKGEPTNIELKLTLTGDDELVNEFLREAARLRASYDTEL